MHCKKKVTLRNLYETPREAKWVTVKAEMFQLIFSVAIYQAFFSESCQIENE